ncbi:hypothetical protein MTR67_008403 [Solanum verrucosum]|uniref:RNase H type-1 domain-containing protein n=1 Tax=Solanum verrucosum TaxID=315347 RepID=A0AAF0Q218_SOLVR|nr:hypothetical protein MTR67_008403 [Solanum verrucosum]
MDLGFNGPKYTWSNLRGINFRIWKRLDRAMANDKWLQDMPHTSITHLPSVGSDHFPILMEMNVRQVNYIKYFRFLNCWADQPTFLDTMTDCWDRRMEGDPMWIFHQKMKRVVATLSSWSKMQFGDIYAKVKDYEEKVKIAEESLIQDNTDENRVALHAINADNIKYMKIKDSILRQKSQLHWFKEGDGNSKFFHTLIRQPVAAQPATAGDQQSATSSRRQPASQQPPVPSTSSSSRQSCRPVAHTAEATASHQPQSTTRSQVAHSTTHSSNRRPTAITISFEGDEHIAESACEHFQNIFTGEKKFIDETPMNCIPRLAPILPSLISTNQSGFVKGRSIYENIMLAQEIIHQIKKPTIGSNVVVKLDIDKAYDRVSWSYICLVLRKMGFDEVFIDMTWRIMSNNWYSIIINGKRYGFFHSTRGVGPLAQFTEDNNRFNNDTVSEFIEEGQWNINKIIQLASPTQVHNILATQLQLQQGGILRNSNGDLIFSYFVHLGHGTNNQAEVEAAIFGLSWCVQLNYQKMVLEVDSQMLVDWLLNKSPLLGTSHHKCNSFTPLPLTSHISNTFTHSGKPTLWQIHSPNTAIKSPVPNYTSLASKFQKRQQLIFSRIRQAWQVSEERK